MRLELTPDEIQGILDLLAQQPYAKVNGIINKIASQANAEQNAQQMLAEKEIISNGAVN